MRRGLALLALPLALGCTEVRRVTLEGALLAEPPCEIDAAGDLVSSAVVADVAYSFSYRIPLSVRNSGERGVSPDRFDFRWECNDNGFAADVGPLVVPAYSPSVPFCLSSQQLGGAPFVGYDLVNATGPRIGPGELGVVEVELVPSTLGDGLDTLWSLARLADGCLRSNPVGDDATPECAAFYTAWPYGEASPEDVDRLAPFARFDGRYLDEVLVVREGSTPPVVGPAYPLTAHGVLYLLDDGGREVETNEIEIAIDVCRNCGARQDDLRQPRTGAECYAPRP